MAWTHLTTAARNAAADAIVDLIDAGDSAGEIRIYDGAPPSSANDAVTTQTLLATLTFSATAFQGSSGGTVTANAVTQDSSADATGTATWARIVSKDTSTGATTVMDVDVGTGTQTIVLNTANIVSGGVVKLVTGSFTMPSGES